MATKKTQSARKTPPTTETTEAPAAPRGRNTNPAEESLRVWLNFAKEVGTTTSEFVRRFGDEQQQNYEKWAASLRDQMKPRQSVPDVEEIRERFRDWNELAQEIGQKVTAAFTTGQDLQKQLFENWSKAQTGGSQNPADQVREYAEMTQKFWSGLSKELYEKAMASFAPQVKFEDFVRTQEESMKDFAENFRKLTYSYFTSPPFVTLFGKTLDASLDLQRQLKETGGALANLSPLPTKKEVAQLQQSLAELANKVSRLEDKIR